MRATPLFFGTFLRLLRLSGFTFSPPRKSKPSACFMPSRLLPNACSALWWVTLERKSPHAATPRPVDTEPAMNKTRAASSAPPPNRRISRSSSLRATRPHTPNTTGPTSSSTGNTRTMVA